MTAPTYTDRFGDVITLANKFILYRGRSIPYTEIKEIRVKNTRVMLNHFVTNQSHPKMCIIFDTKEKSAWFHDEILGKMYFQKEE